MIFPQVQLGLCQLCLGIIGTDHGKQIVFKHCASMIEEIYSENSKG